MIGLVLTLACPLWAQDVSVVADVSQNQVDLGGTLQLTVTVNGGKDIATFDLPKMDGLDARFLGPSTRISIMNGQYSSSKAYIYNLLPLKVGKFQIPSITVSVDGKEYQTQAIDIEVVNSGTASPDQSTASGQEASLKDKIFMVLKPSKTEVYVNEPVPVKILLYVSNLSVRDVHYPEFDKSNMSVEEYKQPKQYNQVVNGVRYDVVEFETTIYPAKSGELKLGPASLECSLLYRTQNANSPFGQMESFFDDSFFSGFNYSKRPLTIQSLEASVNVLDLPEANRPSDFSGAIGDFKFEVSADPKEIKVGDPITVKMRVSGEGNLKTAELPAYKNLNHLKTYDPQVKEDGATKTLEQVLIPQIESVKEIPSVQFSYFDPATKDYKTIKQGPFPITVNALPKEEQPRVVRTIPNEERTVGALETLGRDIVYIKPEIGVLHKRGDAFYLRTWYWVFVFLFFGLWISALFYFEHNNRLLRDAYYARRMLAHKEAKRGLSLARKALEVNNLQGVYDDLFKTLQRYLADKYKVSQGEITKNSLKAHLGQSYLDPQTISRLESFLEEAEQARYASLSLTKDQARKSIETVEVLIGVMERSSK